MNDLAGLVIEKRRKKVSRKRKKVPMEGVQAGIAEARAEAEASAEAAAEAAILRPPPKKNELKTCQALLL